MSPSLQQIEIALHARACTGRARARVCVTTSTAVNSTCSHVLAAGGDATEFVVVRPRAAAR